VFEHELDYPTALTPPGSINAGKIVPGLKWILERHEDAGGTILLLAPGRRNLDDNKVLQQFARLVPVVTATWRTLSSAGWSGGPAVAAWPNEEWLLRIADDRRTRALCVLGWSERQTDPWRKAVDPVLLGGGHSALPERQLIADQVIIEALKSLTLMVMVNQSNNLAGSFDHDLTVSALRTLHQSSHVLVPDDIYTWTIAHGWPWSWLVSPTGSLSREPGKRWCRVQLARRGLFSGWSISLRGWGGGGVAAWGGG